VALLIVSLIVTMIRSALCDDRDHGPGLAGRGGDHVVSAPRDGRNTAVLELQSGATAVHIGVPKRVVKTRPQSSQNSTLAASRSVSRCSRRNFNTSTTASGSGTIRSDLAVLVARGGSLRPGGIAAPAAQLEHVDQDQYRARQARFSSATQWPALGPTAHESDPPRRSVSTQESARDDLLVQQSGPVYDDHPWRFLGRFAYDLAAPSVVRDKPEALAGSLRAVAR
jgi:hypothetical protein